MTTSGDQEFIFSQLFDNSHYKHPSVFAEQSLSPHGDTELLTFFDIDLEP